MNYDLSNFRIKAMNQVKGINKPKGNIMTGFFKISSVITAITLDGTIVKATVTTIIGRISG
jgi:hypothetical protein